MSRSVLSLVLVALVSACGSISSKTPTVAKTSLGQTTVGGLSVELFTDSQLQTGLSPLYLKLTDSGGHSITDATLTVTLQMTMSGGMQHGAPVLGDPSVDSSGLYHVDVVFQMASSATDIWAVSVDIARAGTAAVEAQFNALTVVDSGRALSFSYTPLGGTQTDYVASFNLAGAAKVGLNPVVVTLHQTQDMMLFAPVDDATLVLDPEMPSMGHGAPGSVNPTLASSGYYSGQVAFSMAGTWETTVTVSEAGQTLGTPKFTTTF
jgi:YtkA-like